MKHSIDKDTSLSPEVIADTVTMNRHEADLLCSRARRCWRESESFRQSFAGKDGRDVLRDWFRQWVEDKPFRYEVNLDDPEELREFLERYEPAQGRQLMNMLKFRGKGAVGAADALMNYARNKRVANILRAQGDIESALVYESICDRIYNEDIQPFIDCW